VALSPSVTLDSGGLDALLGQPTRSVLVDNLRHSDSPDRGGRVLHRRLERVPSSTCVAAMDGQCRGHGFTQLSGMVMVGQ
jgi:hypothetical protein